MAEETIQDWIARVPAHFVAENAAGVDADAQLHLTGEEAGDWYLTIRDNQAAVSPGISPNPRITLTADSQDVLRVLSGRMDPMRAFMQGKLRVSGDMNFAWKLANMFRQ